MMLNHTLLIVNRISSLPRKFTYIGYQVRNHLTMTINRCRDTGDAGSYFDILFREGDGPGISRKGGQFKKKRNMRHKEILLYPSSYAPNGKCVPLD